MDTARELLTTNVRRQPLTEIRQGLCCEVEGLESREKDGRIPLSSSSSPTTNHDLLTTLIKRLPNSLVFLDSGLSTLDGISQAAIFRERQNETGPQA